MVKEGWKTINLWIEILPAFRETCYWTCCHGVCATVRLASILLLKSLISLRLLPTQILICLCFYYSVVFGVVPQQKQKDLTAALMF